MNTDTASTQKHLEKFIANTRRNCDISDAQGAGLYSICGLALRLRDLHKWEKHLPPWVEKDSSQILDWIDKKEQLWETLHDTEFEKLPLPSKIYDPFDTQKINKALSPYGLFYGAGYAHSLKPTFFLARIEETKTVNGFKVHVLDAELARDLLTIPALHQDNCILLRQDAARIFLWDQMAYLNKSGKPALELALKHCGLPDIDLGSRKKHFEAILAVQKNTYLYHEIGELTDTVFDRKIWQKIVSQFPHTPVELLARTVKDLLADTGSTGTLNHIIKEEDAAGIGFYAAFIDGFSKVLFPELRAAFDEFAKTGDWDEIKKAKQEGFLTASRYAGDMISIFQEGKNASDMRRVHDRIVEKLVQPHIKP